MNVHVWRAWPFRLGRNALLLAASCACMAVAKARTEPLWSLVDLGAPYGQPVVGFALNNLAQVTGSLQRWPFSSQFGYIWTDLDYAEWLGFPAMDTVGHAINSRGHATGRIGNHLLVVTERFTWYPSFDGMGRGINDAGQVTGHLVHDALLNRAFRLDADGTMTFLGALGGLSSEGWGINAAGQITGVAETSTGSMHAFVHDAAGMRDLGTLGGSFSRGHAINDRGDVAGVSTTLGNAAERAFLYTDGVMHNLGTLGGNVSEALAINAAGQVVGRSTTASGSMHPFLFTQGRMHNLNQLPVVLASDWVLGAATGINDVGQILVQGVQGGIAQPALLTLRRTTWEGAADARWDDADNWSFGIAPNRNSAVAIDPASSRRVFGPTGRAETGAVAIGGDPLNTQAVARLEMVGGEISMNRIYTNTEGLTEARLTITTQGVLAGHGLIRTYQYSETSFVNRGRIVAEDLIFQGSPLINAGTVEGAGRLGVTTGLFNRGGTVAPTPGQRLLLDGVVFNDQGVIEARRGELDIRWELFNSDRIVMLEGTLRTDWLFNQGRLDITSGNSDIFGFVSNQPGGRVVVSGEGQATFWDAFGNAGELRVSAHAVATFFGDFYATSSGTLTGAGAKYFEAGFSVGDSPGIARVEGDVVFGSGAVVTMEIGGATPGTGDDFHDLLEVEGLLTLGGTLVLTSWNSFEAAAGQRFDLFDWGALEGRFDTIDDSGLVLEAGTWLDLSQLYVDGSVAVVPEPERWALWLLGLAAMAGTLRRRRQGHDRTQPQR